MHEEEGIYETADPDRGSNNRGETPDSERYRQQVQNRYFFNFFYTLYLIADDFLAIFFHSRLIEDRRLIVTYKLPHILRNFQGGSAVVT